MNPAIDFNKYYTMLETLPSISATGKVVEVTGLVTEARGPASRLGSICEIYTKENEKKIRAEVLGFRKNRILLVPLDDIRGIGPGSMVVAREQKALISVGNNLLGRVIDGLGNPLDNKGIIKADDKYPIYAEPLNPLNRNRIKKPLDLGIRAVNGLLTIGCGQRIGVFAGSGVGKSVLLGMIARNTNADINVIALIGERGREVNEFIEKELGEEGLKKSVVVVATSDRFPLIRMRGAFIATAIAEYFRDQGKHVNLMMDSVTRFAMAQREIGLALGEPPTTKGYTPSVFTILPKLLERAGTSSGRGTITGLYTVLVEGDDMNDPIADSVRSILDGHIVQGHIDQTAVCTKVEEAQGSWYYTFEYDPSKGNITVEKGSISVNGVSLTVVNSQEKSFQVAIIPFTYDLTNFHDFKEGTVVNLEFDILGKYIAKIIKQQLGK